MSDDDEDDQDQDAEQFGPGGAGSIESFSSSSVNGGTIWVGTSNGLIKVTKDHGRNWDDVTIPKLPNPTRADISAIEASHQDLATAYVAIDYHTTGDYKPYYLPHSRLRQDLDQDRRRPSDRSAERQLRPRDSRRHEEGRACFSPALRARCTSRSTMATHWQSLTLNAPNTSYRDMQINGNDLVVGTYGRSFWVLDDISPLREITPSVANESAHLFKPGDAIRVRRNVNGDTPFPPEIPHA